MIRQITIRTILNGFIVDCGCQTVVFTSREVLLTEIGVYLSNPDETERKYREHGVNAKHLLGPSLECCEAPVVATPPSY